jgi:hypothetical protein
MGFVFCFAALFAGRSAAMEATPVAIPLAPKVAEAKAFIQKNHLRDEVAILVDLSKPSDEKRWFVVDLKSGQTVYAACVAHGKGSGRGRFATVFSDSSATYCSTLGKCEVVGSYNGKHGLSYKLRGLEAGTRNVEKKAIVIHSAWYVEEPFIQKYKRAGNSWGCPALSRESLKDCAAYLKPKTLFWAYNR